MRKRRIEFMVQIILDIPESHINEDLEALAFGDYLKDLTLDNHLDKGIDLVHFETLSSEELK